MVSEPLLTRPWQELDHDWLPVGTPVRVVLPVPGAVTWMVPETPPTVTATVAGPVPPTVTVTVAAPPPDDETFV